MVVVFIARCVKELATLESRVSGEMREGVASGISSLSQTHCTSPAFLAAGISSQQMLAHRKGVIAMLYEVRIRTIGAIFPSG